MSDATIPDNSTGTPRRTFVAQLAATAVGLNGAAFARSLAVPNVSVVPGQRRATTAWDDSWTKRLGAKHRVVFEATNVGGSVPEVIQEMMGNFHDAIGVRDDELHLVFVIRHAAIPMAFNDHLWEKYALGDEFKMKDPTTGEPARRNPFVRTTAADKFSSISADAALDVLQKRGVTLLGCNKAAMFQAANFAKKSGVELAVAQQEVRDNLLPGVILQPNGLYAVVRAEDAGCVYCKV